MIPKTLAVNAAKDSTDLVAKLRAYHNAAQSAPVGDPRRGLRHYGLDLGKGEVRDNVKAGVLEPMVSKVKSLKSALEACTALLRIDDRVRSIAFPSFLSPSLPSSPSSSLQPGETRNREIDTILADHGPARAKGRRWLARALEDGGKIQTCKHGKHTRFSSCVWLLFSHLANSKKNFSSPSSSAEPLAMGAISRSLPVQNDR